MSVIDQPAARADRPEKVMSQSRLKFGGALLAATATLALGACATETSYRPATGSGFSRTGYSDRQIEPNRYIVSFAGNTYTSRDTVERYLLFRAAELTLSRGYDNFILADKQTDLRSRTYSTPGLGYGGFGYGGIGAFGGWGPSWRYRGRGFGWRSWDPYFGDPFWDRGVDIQTVDKFEATAEIVLGKGPKPRDNIRAFDARAVIDSIGPSVVVPK
jgi:hypothetical protein